MLLLLLPWEKMAKFSRLFHHRGSIPFVQFPCFWAGPLYALFDWNPFSVFYHLSWPAYFQRYSASRMTFGLRNPSPMMSMFGNAVPWRCAINNSRVERGTSKTQVVVNALLGLSFVVRRG
jgi:hypothetical protein